MAEALHEVRVGPTEAVHQGRAPDAASEPDRRAGERAEPTELGTVAHDDAVAEDRAGLRNQPAVLDAHGGIKRSKMRTRASGEGAGRY